MEQSALKKHLLIAWLGALLMALALCSVYFFMGSFRGIYQSHYPKLAAQWADNGSYAVLGMFGTELDAEELAYASRGNDASHHGVSYDPYLKDNRSARLLCICTAFNSTVGALQFLIRDINKTWILTKFLCCVAWFVLIYFLTLRSTESVPVSVFCATFITGFSYILTLLFVSNLVWGGGLVHVLTHNFWSLISYGRTEGVLRLPRAGFTYAVLFFACYCLVKALETQTWKWIVLSGAMGGLLAYTHPDVWMSYLGAEGLVAVVLWFRNRKQFWRVTCAFVLSLLLSVPLLATGFPPDKELLYRTTFGAESPPRFLPATLIYLLAFGAVLRWKRKPVDLVIGASAGASFFIMHVGFLLGYSFDPYRWQYIGNIFLFLIAVSFLPRRVSAKTVPWLAASAALALGAFTQGVSYAAIHFPFSALPKDYEDALSWLDHNTPTDSVVLTLNPEVDELIPTYTRDKVVTAFVGAQFSDIRLLDEYERMLGALRLLGVNEDKFMNETVLETDAVYNRRSLLASGLPRNTAGLERWAMRAHLFCITPPPHLADVMKEGRGHPKNIDPDYVWFGGFEKQYARRDWAAAGGWTEVYHNAEVALYARRRPNNPAPDS